MIVLYAISITMLAVSCAVAACGSANTVSGEVRFHRDVDLPDGATVIVMLLDTSLADGPGLILSRDVILDAERLPVRFRIEYEPEGFDDRNEYTLSAYVKVDGELLYINDTVHPVLTRGAPRHSDVTVISVNPVDVCREPLPVLIRLSHGSPELQPDAELRVRLVDVSDPGDPLVLSAASRGGFGSFPIAIDLPHDGVSIDRHRRYELEAEVWIGGERRYHIPRADWRRAVLSHCPDQDSPIINDVFPSQEFEDE